MQRAEVEGQRRDFAHALCAQFDHACLAGVLHRCGGLPGVSLIQAAVLFVTGVRVGAPLRGEHLAVVLEVYLNGPVRHGHEVADAAVAVDHQAQGRGLYATHRQHALITGLTPQQGKQTAHVHADQPVGARASQCAVVQVEGLCTGFECGQRFTNGSVVQRGQPQALNRAAIPAVIDQFAGDHFAFAVGVGRNHQFAGFTQQTLDGFELAGGFGFDPHLPFIRNDRQVGQHPALVALVVGVWRGGFEQVANAPGNGGVRPRPAAIAASAGAEHGRNILGLGRFFTQKQPHRFTRSCCAEGAQHGRD